MFVNSDLISLLKFSVLPGMEEVWLKDSRSQNALTELFLPGGSHL